MTVASAVVAVGFGLLVGWGLGRYERVPALAGAATGFLAGAVMLVFAYGPDPTGGGGSLLLGCGGALLILLFRRPG